MAFLNKIGKVIGEAAGTATEKAKDFAETTKLKNAISAEEKQINQNLWKLENMFLKKKDTTWKVLMRKL
ncbi:MAG TPA: hypothetical protein GYA03_07225 [Tissierellia bacterium]|nr:hypothetical protein [Tissierellia bacterium]